jgi:hypothetical protein
MLEKPTSVLPLSMPTNRLFQVALFRTGLRPRTAATSRPRSGSAPVRVFWSLPMNPSGGSPAGSDPLPMTSWPVLVTDAGSSARMEATSATLRSVCCAAPLDSAPTVTTPADAFAEDDVVEVALPPQAARLTVRVATAVPADRLRMSLLRKLGMVVLARSVCPGGRWIG